MSSPHRTAPPSRTDRSTIVVLTPALLAVLGLGAAPAAAQILFGPPVSTPLPGTSVPFFLVGDVNDDGLADVILPGAGAPKVRVGDGAGHFGAETTLAVDMAKIGRAHV